MPTILLIRHGESQANAGEPTSCPCTVELTDKGWKQAEAIARFLQEAQLIPDLILTSSYKRTKQTAAPATLAFFTVPEKEWPVQEFTYLSMWHDENSTITERRPAVEAYWENADPELVEDSKSQSPEPESFKQFISRVRDVKERLENTELDIIAIFTHEQFITAFRWLSERDSRQITPETMRKFRAFLEANPIPNGALVQGKYSRANWRYEVITPRMEDLTPVFAE